MAVGHRWFRLDGTGFDADEFTWLWLLAAATYGVGDVVTTVALVWFSETITEANPLVRYAVESFGHAGLVSLKLAVFCCCIAISLDAAHRDDDGLLYYGAPLVLTAVGLFATANNLWLLSL